MTLVVTVLTASAIHQSADLRLSWKGRPPIDSSMKVSIIQYPSWNGCITYTGIGTSGSRQLETSELVLEWLTKMYDATPDDIARRLQQCATKWLNRELSKAATPEPHTFVFSYFNKDLPCLSVISNHENAFGQLFNAKRIMSVTQRRYRSRPLVFASGRGSSLIVNRAFRQRIELAERGSSTCAEKIRSMLRKLTAEASENALTEGTVSSESSTFSLYKDSYGVGFTEGDITFRTLLRGLPKPDLASVLGSQVTRGGITRFAGSKSQIARVNCSPKLITASSHYSLLDFSRRFAHKDILAMSMVDINDCNIILGSYIPTARNTTTQLWVGDPRYKDGIVMTSGLESEYPHQINDTNFVASRASKPDGLVHAIVRKVDEVQDFARELQGDCESIAINNHLDVAVKIRTKTNDQTSDCRFLLYRAGIRHEFAVSNSEIYADSIVAINDTGAILLRSYQSTIDSLAPMPPRNVEIGPFALPWSTFVDLRRGIQELPCTTLWIPELNILEHLIGAAPIALNSDGAILCICNTDNGVVAHLKPRERPLIPLGTAPGFYPLAMNDNGTVVGTKIIDHVVRGWIWHESQSLEWLPYHEHHNTMPSAINNSNTIVGNSSCDHCQHAVMWCPV